MKFTPEVQTALDTLKQAVENDFERHRLNVLERDLTSPPKVEILDDMFQYFNGMIFRKNGDGDYGMSQFKLHRAVWFYNNGEILPGYEIHHIDENKNNNDISNLQLLTKSEHRRVHMALLESKEYVCKQCGKKFFSKKVGGQKFFCSRNCKASWIRHSEHMQEIRQCAYCGKEFTIYKHKETVCCSRSCAAKMRWQNYRQQKLSPSS